jgi:hypothetical protein
LKKSKTTKKNKKRAAASWESRGSRLPRDFLGKEK